MQINRIGTINNQYANLSNTKHVAPSMRDYPQMSQLPVMPIYFTGLTNEQKLQTANEGISILNEKISNKDFLLTENDEGWLNKLNQAFGVSSFTVADPKNPLDTKTVNSKLTVSNINSKYNNDEENGLISLKNALSAMVAASTYKPIKKTVGGVDLTVHNSKIANLLKPSYDFNSTVDIVKYLDDNDVFDLTDDPNCGLLIDHSTGLVKTCGAGENWEMNDRLWVTDSMRVGDVQKILAPASWAKSLESVAHFYSLQQDKFDEICKNPDLYRNGGAMEGIPHIFLPKTFEGDPNWFNNKRLESHGLALKEFCTAIVDGLVFGAPYGWHAADEIPSDVLNAIQNLADYFGAIEYESAPSAGNWEEVPLKGGLTWDTESIRCGFEALHDLLFNPLYDEDKGIETVRNYFSFDKKYIEEQMQRGEKRVRETYLAEAPNIRENDASLAFITTSTIKLDDDPLKDIEKHVEILEKLEKNLVRENGIIRYAPFNFALKDGSIGYTPDSYLNLNYFVAMDKNGKVNLEWKEILDEFGSKDASDPDVFNARAKLSTKDKEAQWFMVSEMSSGYGMQLEKLMNFLGCRKPTQKEAALIEKLKAKQAEFLNRALARLSAENPNDIHQCKANGLSMPSVTLPEAYQYVTDINGNTKMLPGTNAPLAWALASLYKALVMQVNTSYFA